MKLGIPYAPEACHVDDPCSQEANDWAMSLWQQGFVAGVKVDYVETARACLVVVRVRREIRARQAKPRVLPVYVRGPVKRRPSFRVLAILAVAGCVAVRLWVWAN